MPKERGGLASAEEPATEPPVATQRAHSDGKTFTKRALLFLLVGALLYLLAYAAAEQLASSYAKRNRFHVVKTAAHQEYDYVILGASHAAVFDYEDMNARLEESTGAKILNLSVVGGGITVNRLLMEYFLAGHRTANAVYFVDSFAFYAREWNEDRLHDTRLFVRAPFDPVLVRILFENPATRHVALDYLVGFSKINNPDRLKPDVSDDETVKFKTRYRPVEQIDRQRIEYLYPDPIDPQVFSHYMGEFETFIRSLKQRNVRLIVVKPPIPARVHAMLPNEAQFDATLKAVLARHGVEFHDFSLVSNDVSFFFDTDHLNRTGVLGFFEAYLKAILKIQSREGRK